MVTLRVIAEALGYEVAWNNELRSVKVGEDISLKIGEDKYITGEKQITNLGIAPIIMEDRTFVHIDFFETVVGIKEVKSSLG